MSPSRTRDAVATKAQVLATAEELFSENGFSGTSLRMISKRCGVSVPLIVFHFISKEGLYDAVKQEIIERFLGTHGLPLGSSGAFEDFLEHLVRSMFEFYRDNPSMVRLSSWMRLEGDTKWWPRDDEWFEAVLGGIRAAQARDEIRKDMDALSISGIICGSVHVWWEFRDQVVRHSPEGVGQRQVDDRYVSDLLTFVLSALATQAA